MRLFASCCFLAVLTFSLSAQADTAWLKNGDRLTGHILLLDNGKLLLKTNYAGTITLDIKKVATLESDQPYWLNSTLLPPNQLKHCVQALKVALL